MNNLIRLINRYGGTVQFRSAVDDFGPCSEHPEYPVPPAVAEITALDTPELPACEDCLPGAIEQAMTTAEEQGERSPEITVTVSRPAPLVDLPPEIALPLAALDSEDPAAARLRMAELHEQGWSYDAIGRALGISRHAARWRTEAAPQSPNPTTTTRGAA